MGKTIQLRFALLSAAILTGITMSLSACGSAPTATLTPAAGAELRTATPLTSAGETGVPAPPSPAPAATSTQTAIPTITPTDTPYPPTATPSPTATATSTATSAPTPTSTPFVVVQARTLNLRSGPGTVYDRIGQLRQDTLLALTARSTAGDWYQVCCVNGRPGWVSADLVRISNPGEEIPATTDIPPTPTPVPVTSTPPATPTPVSHCIYAGLTLCPGYDMGVEDSASRRGWVTDMNGYMKMAYPADLEWGAIFITVGPPKDLPRPGQDLSNYRYLSVELKGERGGEYVNIGIKDNDDPDDGKEKKLPAADLPTTWKTFTFTLSDFRWLDGGEDRGDPTKLCVVIEFVFEPTWPQTVYFRNVRYLP